MPRIPSEQYNKVKDRHGKFVSAVEALGQAARQAGPLGEKVAHLVQLAAASAVRSEGAVHSHTRRALEAGATPDEIRHAIVLLTSTIGFPTVVAALSWTDDVIEGGKRR